MATFEGLRLPVVAAPMFLVSGPELVVAACKSGIVGSFPAPNCRTVDDLDCWMGKISDQLAGSDGAPWAVNLVTHSTNTRLAEDLRLVAEYKPAVVITALGSPIPAIETVKAYGGTVIADITGTPASWLRPSLVANGLDPDRLAKPAERDYDSTADVAARWKDLWAAGQGLQAIRSVEPVAAVVGRLAEEYQAAAERLSRRGLTGPA
jgi:NAD(P)H-dependent flavin oxidoreductase YrpB (nitropropane dioxygenase family)